MKELDALVKDAIAFVRYFGYPIAQSAPHIYLSALPFAPSSSVISKLYTPRFSTLRLVRGRLMKWPALEMMIPVKRRVYCVAWSRNGEYIAVGMYKKVYLWSTSTGMHVSGPFKLVKSWCPSHSHTMDSGLRQAFGMGRFRS